MKEFSLRIGATFFIIGVWYASVVGLQTMLLPTSHLPMQENTQPKNAPSLSNLSLNVNPPHLTEESSQSVPKSQSVQNEQTISQVKLLSTLEEKKTALASEEKSNRVEDNKPVVPDLPLENKPIAVNTRVEENQKPPMEEKKDIVETMPVSQKPVQENLSTESKQSEPISSVSFTPTVIKPSEQAIPESEIRNPSIPSGIQLLPQSNIIVEKGNKYVLGILNDGRFVSWDIRSKELKSIVPGTYQQIWIHEQNCILLDQEGNLITKTLVDGELGNTVTPYTSFAYSYDGKLFATGYSNGQVCVWTANGKLHKKLSQGNVSKGSVGHAVAVRSMQFSKKGHLVSGDENGKFIQWELDTGAEYLSQEIPSRGTIACIAISSDGTYVAVGSGNNVYLYSEERERPYLISHRGSVIALAISVPQGQLYSLAQQPKETLLHITSLQGESIRKVPFLAKNLILQGNSETLVGLNQ